MSWFNDLSTMPSYGWQIIDLAHLLQKVILLQLLNRTPEKPSEINLSKSEAREKDFSERILEILCDWGLDFLSLSTMQNDGFELAGSQDF